MLAQTDNLLVIWGAMARMWHHYDDGKLSLEIDGLWSFHKQGRSVLVILYDVRLFMLGSIFTTWTKSVFYVVSICDLIYCWSIYKLIYFLVWHTVCISIRLWRGHWDLVKIYIYHYIVSLPYVISSSINTFKPEQTTICRCHFPMIIAEWKCLYFDSYFTEVMATSSNGNIFCVTGPVWGNPSVTGRDSLRPMTWRFGVFVHVHLKKRLSKTSRLRWFEPPSRSSWRRCNVVASSNWSQISVNSCNCLVPKRWQTITMTS